MKNLHSAIVVAGLVATTLAGCATLGRSEAKTLRDDADQLLQTQDLEPAYRKLALIRVRHPESPEAREVYPVAAAIFKRMWWRNRYTNPESPWLTEEPEFLFGWLESFADEAFPLEQAETLLLGMPTNFYQQYEAYAANSAVLARWPIAMEKDNGIVESISTADAPD